MLKKHNIIVGIAIMILICAAIHYLRMPNITIVYDYNGNAYTQNMRSLFRKKITLEGYTDISFVTPKDNGYYCHAKNENGNGCFLSVVNDKVAVEIPEDYSNATVYGAMIYNDMFLIDYSYDISRINQSTSYLLIDFSTGEKYYYDNAELVLSSNSALWWISDESIICKYQNNVYEEITVGGYLIGIQDGCVLFVKSGEVYQIDCETNEVSICEYKTDFRSYLSIGTEPLPQFENNYYVGCKYSFFSGYDPTALITHTSVSDINTGKTVVLYSSVGKVYNHIKIIE